MNQSIKIVVASLLIAGAVSATPPVPSSKPTVTKNPSTGTATVTTQKGTTTIQQGITTEQDGTEAIDYRNITVTRPNSAPVTISKSYNGGVLVNGKQEYPKQNMQSNINHKIPQH